MASWNYDIAPTLQMVSQQNSLTPFADFAQGQQAGMQQALVRNQLDTIARQNQARPLAGAALSGDQNALKQLYSLDPQEGMQIAQNTGQDYAGKMARSGAVLYGAKDGTPEQKVAAVQAAGQIMGSPPSPQELDPNNFGSVLAQHIGLSDSIAQANADRTYKLQQGTQGIELATLQNQINNQNRNYGLENYKAQVEAYNAGGGMMSGQPMPQPPGGGGGAAPIAIPSQAASPVPTNNAPVSQPNTGAPGQIAQQPINPAVANPIPQPMPPQQGAGVQPQQQPQAPVQRGALPSVPLDPQTGKADPVAQKAFLDAVPPTVAPLLQAAANFQLDPNKLFQMRGNSRALFDSMLTQYTGGTYNAQTYPLQFAMQKSVTTGQYAQTLNSVQKVTQHMAQYVDYNNALQNGDIPAANAIKNSLAQALGYPAQTNANILASGLGTEFAKSMKNSGALDVGSIEDAQKNLATSQSPAQAAGALQTMAHMVASAVDPITFQYKNLMGKDLNWASPSTVAAMQKIGLDPRAFGVGGSSPSGAPAASGTVIQYDAQGNRVQ